MTWVGRVNDNCEGKMAEARNEAKTGMEWNGDGGGRGKERKVSPTFIYGVQLLCGNALACSLSNFVIKVGEG